MTPPAHGVPLPANPQCPICSTEQNLSRCKACQVVSYCGRDHQTLHWKQGHKATCSDIKNTNLMIKDETEILNSLPATPEFDEKPFENSVGHFWNIYDTRNYMRARYMHAEALLLVKNRTAVEAALDHLLDMLRLARSDHIGIRNKVPALFLRLQKDQECYDFVKWWFLSAKDCDYDSEDTSLPFMDIKDADAFEPVKEFPLEFGDLSHIVMLLLLKWRLSCELKAFGNATTVAGGRLPAELIDQIRSSMVSPATKNNKKLMQDVENGRDISSHIESLNKQITKLYGAVVVRNSHYLPALIDPGEHMKARPVNYEPGSVEEMQVSLRETYDAWLETPGALEWVKNILAA